MVADCWEVRLELGKESNQTQIKLFLDLAAYGRRKVRTERPLKLKLNGNSQSNSSNKTRKSVK